MYMQKLNLLLSIFLLTLLLNSDNVNRRKVYLKEVIIEETITHKEKISLLYHKKFSEYKNNLYDIVKKDKL